ncbi:MAG: anthranilate phosphoribosyltransferase, partial [Cytophagales bacterium]
MVNPALPKKQLVGVFNLELARQYAYLYQQTDKEFLILHSLDGFDEISLTSPFKFFFNGGEKLLAPRDLQFDKLSLLDLKGGETVEEAGKLFIQILEGNGTKAQNAVVLANAGMALYCAEQSGTIDDALQKARESLDSGKALNCFKKLINN